MFIVRIPVLHGTFQSAFYDNKPTRMRNEFIWAHKRLEDLDAAAEVTA